MVDLVAEALGGQGANEDFVETNDDLSNAAIQDGSAPRRSSHFFEGFKYSGDFMGALSTLLPKAVRVLLCPKEKLCHVIGDVKIAPLPQVATKALTMLRDDNFDLKRVASLLATDAAFTVAILRHVNSAAFGLRHPVTAAEHAVSYLGRSQLESVLIATAVRQAVPRGQRGGFAPNPFWKQAQRRAFVAGKLAAAATPELRAESVTAALLQDIAVPILAHARDDYAAALAGSVPSADTERDVVGFDHAEVGGWLCESWGVPPSLTIAVSLHHDQSESPFPAATVAAALDDDPSGELLCEVARTLGINGDVSRAILDDDALSAGE